MIIARWQIDARFGHKDAAIQSMRRWHEEIGARIGFGPDRTRMLVGHVGGGESTIVTEVRLDGLDDLEKAFGKLAKLEAHESWGKELEPHVVSGTNRWEVYRVL